MKRPKKQLFFCLKVTLRGVFCVLLGVLIISAAFFEPVMTAGGDIENGLPVLMYHSVLRDRKKAGQYVITADELEEDFKWLSDNGCVSLTASEAVEILSKGGTLPEKSVMITFDDGCLNVLTYALPLLEKYDLKAVVAVVGSYSEQFSLKPDPNPAYAYLSWDDINKLKDSGRVEIANHSYALHSEKGRLGASRIKGETDAEYFDLLREDIGRTQKLLKDNCSLTPTTFVYPFGAIGEGSLGILSEMGFTAALTCSEKINPPKFGDKGLLVLGRFNRPSGVSTWKMMRKLALTG